MSERLSTQDIRREINELVARYFEAARPAKTEDPPRLPLSVPPFGAEEVIEALDSLLTTNLTMGTKVRAFEQRFAEYIGVRDGVMVNSGSSANLLALSVLSNPLLEGHLQAGDEVITPAVTWATTVYPIAQTGAVPVLVDVDLETFNIAPGDLERALTPRTRALMVVHLLGNPCRMDAIVEFARAHNLFLIEDSCEAHGAEFKGRRVGSFGHLSTFSFYFSHHITTIEGGMLLTSDERLLELARAIRVFGWVRDLRNRAGLSEQYPNIDWRYLFVNTGYNFRPTEIQGAFGIHQLPRLDGFIEARRANARYWIDRLRGLERYFFLPREQADTRHVWLFFPLLIRPDAPFTRAELAEFLEARHVETRPIMTGNIEEQPVMRHVAYRSGGALPNARLIMRNGLLVGMHHGIGQREREALVGYLEEFVDGRAPSRR